MFNPAQIKTDFPILSRRVDNKPLIYLDNAATSQKPQVVIQAITDYYQQHNANVHRGVHQLSEESTDIFETSKQQIAHFFGADTEELILTRNATEAMNGIAYGWAERNLQAGGVILTTLMEHHANIVPWQEVCKRTGSRLEFINLTADGQLDITDLKNKIKESKIKIITFTHISNVLGTVNPVQEIVQIVKKQDPTIKILIDGAQSAPHVKIDFHHLGIDFFAFSGHKMLGPMGIGGVLIKKELLQLGEVQPWLFGGGMIGEVYTDHTIYNENLSDRFIAGTPDVASTVGLAAACDYLSDLNMENVELHDQELTIYALAKLTEIKELQVVGPDQNRLGSVAFIYQGVHAHDVAQVLASEGVAVRSGHHCCMPLHTHFGWQATTRASFQVYSGEQDVDALINALHKVKQVFGV
jgi:cysteine desulfurase/selenocysteine lyase